MSRSAQIRLGALVLVAGAASLAVEVTGARLLAPFFGASDVVWANVIGLILVFLSLGYLWGGRLADRHPSERALGLVALVAAAGIAVLPFATQPIFRWSSDAFVHLSAGAFVGSFVAAMAMFALPVTALGAVAPWAVRLAVRDVGEAGTVAGRLYALSTLGSIAGTFLPVLVLVPAIGSRRTFLVVAALLALAAVPMLGPRSLGAPAVAVGLLLIPTGLVKPGTGVLFEGESPYQFVQVAKVDGVTELHLNEGWAIHSEYRPGTVLTGGYWDTFLALPLLSRAPAGRLAVLGNAAGTVARAYGTAWPRTHVDGVELDPLVTQVGRRYFGEGRLPMLTVHTDDARPYLAHTGTRYDEIVVDAYRQPYIPFYLTTKEFFTLVRDRLTRGGVAAINVGTPPDEQQVVGRIAATMRAVFGQVWSARWDRFTSIVIGLQRLGDPRPRLRAATGLPRAASRALARELRPVAPDTGAVLTDDRAPIEWLTDRAILAYLREGAPGANP
jgi:spermidine synthase